MNKRTILLLTCFFAGFTFLYAQVQHPVKWAYGKKKIGEDAYNIYLRATIDGGWHVYAQNQPENSISKPTSFRFNTGTEFVIVGKAKEVGKLIKFKDPPSGLEAFEYTSSVDFVQEIKVKSKSATTITGTITYQACNDKMCLPPEDVNFTIPLK